MREKDGGGRGGEEEGRGVEVVRKKVKNRVGILGRVVKEGR